MTDLVTISLQGVPPSKNARTRFNRRSGVIYTAGAVRAWMEATALQVRLARKATWQPGMEMVVVVQFVCQDMHAWDLDGALPCLMDAVCAGLMPADRKRPPDEYVVELTARKVRGNADVTSVSVKAV